MLRTVGVLAILLVAGVSWVVLRGIAARAELQAALPLAGEIQQELQAGNAQAAVLSLARVSERAETAHALTSDPVWSLFEAVPVLGSNLRAFGDLAEILRDVTAEASEPFAQIAGGMDVSALTPVGGRIPIDPLVQAEPHIGTASQALTAAAERAMEIDTTLTVPQVSAGVEEFQGVMAETATTLDAVHRAALLLPTMLGLEGPREYLLIFQNNAELRASGGIPGALAIIRAEGGTVDMTQQASSADFPEYPEPVLDLPLEVRGLYSDLVGTYLQDVTLTPDFPTSAALAREMWQREFGADVDGVVSFDPVGLSGILAAIGPLTLPDGDVLTAENVVPKLLSEVYVRYPDPSAQDDYFAGVAAATFDAIAAGGYDGAAMLKALAAAGAEHRILVWSADEQEQETIAGTDVATVLPAEDGPDETLLGVFFNDATGAKMDFYLQTAVQHSTAVCRADGAANYRASVQLTNSVPAEAVAALPDYITGAGLFGVEPGYIKTRVVVYGPEGGATLASSLDGEEPVYQAGTDGTRPVALVDVLLAPGETSTLHVDFLGSGPVEGELGIRVTPQTTASVVSRSALSCGSVPE